LEQQYVSPGTMSFCVLQSLPVAPSLQM